MKYSRWINYKYCNDVQDYPSQPAILQAQQYLVRYKHFFWNFWNFLFSDFWLCELIQISARRYRRIVVMLKSYYLTNVLVLQVVAEWCYHIKHILFKICKINLLDKSFETWRSSVYFRVNATLKLCGLKSKTPRWILS